MNTATVERLVERWSAISAFVTVGALSIVAGGLVAATTRPTGFDDGPWVAAYLVLVGGVAQLVLGVGQAYLAPDPPSRSTTNLEAASWNIGLVATIGGTLLNAPWLTTLGGLSTAAALILLLASVRRTVVTVRLLTYSYRAIAVFVLISVPVGVALGWLRHG